MLKKVLNVSIVVFFMAIRLTVAQGIQVNPLTGNGSMYIPIYTVSSGDVSVPIGVSYSTNGVKVAEGPGLLGYTWQLDAGGQVSREVRGLPDDLLITQRYIPQNTSPVSGVTVVENMRMGWLHNPNVAELSTLTFLEDGSLSTCSDEFSTNTYLSGLYKYDVEPDFFYINAPGLNLSFVFGNDKQIKFFGQSDAKITYKKDRLGNILKFEVINDRGTKYVFEERSLMRLSSNPNSYDVLEADYRYYTPIFLDDKGASFANEWKLTEMVDVYGNKVAFEYEHLLKNPEALKMSDVSYSSDFELFIKYNTTYKKVTGGDNKVFYNQAILKRIISNNVSIEFLIDYKDLGLDDVLTEQAPPKDLVYDEVWPYVAADYDQLNKLAILKRINVFTGERYSGLLSKFFEFNYEVIKKDVTIDKFELQIFLKSLQEVGRGVEIAPYFFDYYGVDYNTHISALDTTGSNEYDFWGYPASFPGNDAYPQVYIYDNLNNAASEYSSIIPIVGKAGMKTLSGKNRLASLLSECFIGSLKKVTFPSGGSQEIEYSNNEFYDPKYYNSTNSSSYTGAGIRVDKLTLNDNVSINNNIVTTYEYKSADNKPSGRINYLPVYALTVPVYKNPVTGTRTNYNNLSASTRYDYLTIRTSKSISERHGSYVLYERVKVSQTNQGYTVYEYNIVNGQSDIPAMFGDMSNGAEWAATKQEVARSGYASGSQCKVLGFVKNGYYTYPYSPQTNYDFQRGLLSQISYYDLNNVIQKKVEYTYGRVYSQTSPSIVRALHFDILPDETLSRSFVYGQYNLLTELSNELVSQSEFVYSPANGSRVLSSETQYEFGAGTDPHRRIKKVVSTNSDLSEYSVAFKYPEDYNTTTPVGEQATMLNLMKTKNIVNIPIEKTNYFKPNGSSTSTVLGSSLTLFSNFSNNGLVFPLRTLNLKNTTSFTPSYISNNSFVYDNDYFSSGTNISYNKEGRMTSSQDLAKNRSGVHYAYSGMIPVLTISGAFADEVLYNHFNPKNESSYSFSLVGSWAENPSTQGRKDANSLVYESGKVLSGSIKINNPTEKVVLRFYYKSTASRTVTLLFKNGSTTVSTHTIPLTSSSTWKYVTQTLTPSSALPANATVEFSCNGAITLDDLLVFPERAFVGVVNYDSYFNPVASINAYGQEDEVEYDGLNRKRLLRDMDDNILTRNTFTDISYTKPVSACFEMEMVPYSMSVIYKAVNYYDPLISYTWTIDGVATVGTYQNTRTNRDDQEVTLTLRKNGVVLDEVTLRPSFNIPPSICIDGPVEWTGYNISKFEACTVSEQDAALMTSTTFHYMPSEVYPPCVNCNLSLYKYDWQIKQVQNDGTITWASFGTNSPTVTILDIGETYTIRCTVKDLLNRMLFMSEERTIKFWSE
ncbi:hypothetical protein QWY31_08115 [Cytophagales bacterium LB-30]|uniref:CBM-cenC domain-containing protein n=1 Tax=Shiella aurantiaca TaxID=3058365 RepID=A0ABT8F5F9_9BACT|nr:hypothetical protein [Shiella aurantiaca]MDN4165461.1 hypothetical protein [Shiella aurantiaca]